MRKILGVVIWEKNERMDERTDWRTDKQKWIHGDLRKSGESESCIDTDKYVFFNTLHAYSRKKELMSNSDLARRRRNFSTFSTPIFMKISVLWLIEVSHTIAFCQNIWWYMTKRLFYMKIYDFSPIFSKYMKYMTCGRPARFKLLSFISFPLATDTITFSKL